MLDRRVSALWWGRTAAVLAGSMVIGTSVFTTLGADVEPDFAAAEFRAGRFDLQGSADGHSFTSHRLQGPNAQHWAVALRFEGLSPADRAYRPFALRLAAGTDYAAQVRIVADSISGTTPGNSQVYQTQDFGCAAADDLTGGVLVLDSSDPGGARVIELAKPVAGQDGQAVNLCFVVEASATLRQGDAGDLGWRFQGESVVA